MTRSTRSTRNACVASTLALIVGATLVLAGPIDPPAGPVQSTMKTLEEIEPRIPINSETCPGGLKYSYAITQPGSYYLTGDITGEAGKHGILVAARDVTIDLNGFSVIGVPESDDGITVWNFDPQDNVTIRNGVVRAWGSDGISAGATSSGWRLEDVTSSDNGGAGMHAAREATVRNCVSTGNGGTGISAIWSSVVEGCVASANDGAGFSLYYSSVAQACSGLFNAGAGFVLGEGSSATGCAARWGDSYGFDARAGSTLRGCTASENDLDGIVLESRCVAEANNCSMNVSSLILQAAGIRVTGSGNRIDGNNVTANELGIRVDGTSNVIIRNSASANTGGDFGYVGGNTYGPTVSGGGQISNTSPWANLAF